MNRSWMIGLLALAGFMAGCSPTREEIRFDLGELMASGDKHPAPPGIVAQILAANREELEDDKSQGIWSEEYPLVGAVAINLNDDGITDYLVYPCFYSPTFCGAHSIECWIFKGNRNGTYDLVLEGRHDEVRIMPHKTNGFYDIELIYGVFLEKTKFKYDGHRYRGVNENESRN